MAESRKFVALSGAAGIALLALTGGAVAGGFEGSVKDGPAPAREFSYSVTVTGTSDYVFRGVSQTNNSPTMQGAFDISYGIFYAGVWGTGVDGYEGTEVDWYAGFKPVWNDFEFDFGAILYTYPGAAGTDLVEILELKAGVSKSFDKLGVGGIVYWSPDVNGYDYAVYEGALSYELPTLHGFTPTISGLVGYVDNFEVSSDSYTYWNAGLSLGYDKFTFDFRYWDTDLDNSTCLGVGPSLCDERFVFSASVSLP